MKHLDKIANIAVIVGAVVFVVLAIRGDFGFRKVPPSPSGNLVGKLVSLPGTHLPANQNSLLLVVSTNCHFCKDSLPFYKQLTQRTQGLVNVVGVLPQPQSEGQKFLQDAGIKTDGVVSASPDTIGVRGTPTVLLVDGNGKLGTTQSFAQVAGPSVGGALVGEQRVLETRPAFRIVSLDAPEPRQRSS